MVARGGKYWGTCRKGMVVMPSACWQQPNSIENFYGPRQDRGNRHTKDAKYNVCYLSYRKGYCYCWWCNEWCHFNQATSPSIFHQDCRWACHQCNLVYTNAPVTSAILCDITNMVLRFLLCRLIIGVDRTISFPLFCSSTASPPTRNAPPAIPPPIPPHQTQGMPPPPPPPLPSE